MEPYSSSPSSRRKVRFAPKAPTRTNLKTSPLKEESIDEDNEAKEASQAQTLLRQFNDNIARRGRKSTKKSQVVFGGGAATTSIRSFGVPKAERADKRSNEGLKSSNELIPTPLASTNTGTSPLYEEVDDSTTPIPKREFREPWDYEHSYYPTVLPRRRPYKESSEISDGVELRDIATKPGYKQTSTNPASELGLLEENEKGKLLLFQFPHILPLAKQHASTNAKDVGQPSSQARSGPTSLTSQARTALTKGCALEDLSAGYVGKLMVYKSGAVKLKLGNTPFDVSTGSDAKIPRNAVAINTAKKQCCVLGELSEQAIMTTDLNQMLNSVIDLG